MMTQRTSWTDLLPELGSSQGVLAPIARDLGDRELAGGTVGKLREEGPGAHLMSVDERRDN